MSRFGAILAATLALAAAASMPATAQAADSGCQPEAAASRYPSLAGKTIAIAVSATLNPYTFRDPQDISRILGLDADLARAAFGCVGLAVDFAVGAWSGLLPAVIAHQRDVMWDHLYYTPERAKAVDFVLYMTASTGGMVLKGNPLKINALEDLCGRRAAALLGSIEEVILRNAGAACAAAGKGAIEVTTTPDRPGSQRLLQTGRVDLTMGAVDDMIAQYPDLYERAFIIKSGIKCGVAVAKDRPELARAVLDGLTALRANGTEAKIYATYDVDPGLTMPLGIVTE